MKLTNAEKVTIVTLSRRNLMKLLALLDNGAGMGLKKRVDDGMLFVLPEEDKDHYP